MKFLKPILQGGASAFNYISDNKAQKKARKNRDLITKEKEGLDRGVLDFLGTSQDTKEKLIEAMREAEGTADDSKHNIEQELQTDLMPALQKIYNQNIALLQDPDKHIDDLFDKFQASHQGRAILSDLGTIGESNAATEMALSNAVGDRRKEWRRQARHSMGSKFNEYLKDRSERELNALNSALNMHGTLSGLKSKGVDKDLKKIGNKIGDSLENLQDRRNLAFQGRDFKNEGLGMRAGANMQDLNTNTSMNNRLAQSIGQGVGGILDAYDDNYSDEARARKASALEEEGMQKKIRDMNYDKIIARARRL
jgi:hypothetical protein